MDSNTERCKRLVHEIQNLEHTEITELFKLLHANNCDYTRNNNGVFVNLSWLPEDLLVKIESYVAFCTKSRSEVKRYESLCDILNKNIHESKNDRQTEDEPFASFSEQTIRADRRNTASKVSSSMRFYLLKKRFAKQVPLACGAKSDLNTEDFVL
jgi:hypothetical protein